jgi:hypothetical protein
MLPHLTKLIGSTPLDVYKRFGRPARVEKAGALGGFGDAGGHQVNLIQYYDVDGGGRVALFFWGDYQVGGIGFDNLESSRYLTLANFFTTLGTLRTTLLESCIQPDAYHHMPGDAYEWPGHPPNTVMVATATARWATSTGGMLYVRSRLDGHARKAYDPVSGVDRLLPPLRLDALRLLQFVWIPSPGRNRISDAHPGPDEDLSTTSISYPDGPCYSGDGAPIR